MMTAATDFLENALLDHVLRNTAYTSPANVFVQLHTGAPGETAGLNIAAETTRAAATFGAAAAGAIENSAAITWTSVAATEDITHWSIHSLAVAGDALIYGPFAATISLTIGDNLEIPIGDLDITLD